MLVNYYQFDVTVAPAAVAEAAASPSAAFAVWPAAAAFAESSPESARRPSITTTLGRRHQNYNWQQ